MGKFPESESVYTNAAEKSVQEDTRNCSPASSLKGNLRDLHNIIDSIPSLIICLDRDYGIIEYNPEAERILGYKRSDVMGINYLESFIPEEIRKDIKDEIDAVMGGKSAQEHENEVFAADGKKFVISWNANPLIDENSKIVGIIAHGRDVTKSRAAERMLREQLKFQQSLMDAIPSPIFYKNKKGVYLGCNTAFEKSIGMERSELIGHSADELFPKKLADRYHEMDEQLYRNPDTQIYEAPVKTSEGQIRDVIFYKAVYRDADDEITGLIGTILDITKRKEAETQLKESEKRYHELFESILEGISIVDRDDVITFCNPAFAEIFEADSRDDIIGKSLYDFVSEDVASLIKDETVFRRTGKASRYELEILTTKNNKKTVLVSVSPRFDDDGAFLGSIGATVDISDRVNAEKAVRESEKRHRIIAEQTGQIVYEWNRNSEEVQWHGAYEKNTGYSEEEFIKFTQEDWAALIHPEDAEKLKRFHSERHDKPGSFNIEYRIRHKEGEFRHIKDQGITIENDDGSLTALGTLQDITEKNLAAEELEKSLSLVRSTLESTSDGILVTDLQGRITGFNRSFTDIWEIDESTLKRDVAEDLNQYICDQIKGPAGFILDFKDSSIVTGNYDNEIIELKNGKTLECHTMPQVVTGASVGTVWSFHDITDRRKAEKTLSGTIKQYTAMIDTVPALLYAKDAGLKYIVVNHAFCNYVN
ncbi:MAG: PAS domain S-box protein, partial [candidate division Zixibacteria bacterium]|nr:PAS domain S-box protein [candidate division Zixibacteria bacterium]